MMFQTCRSLLHCIRIALPYSMISRVEIRLMLKAMRQTWDIVYQSVEERAIVRGKVN